MFTAAVASVPSSVANRAGAAAAAAATSAAVAAGTAVDVLDKASSAHKAGKEAGADAVHSALEAMFAKLPEAQQDAWLRKKRRAAEVQEQMKAAALDASEPLVDKLIDKVSAHVKQSLTSEPAMPRFVKRVLGAVVDAVLPDVRLELKNAMSSRVLKAQEPPLTVVGTTRNSFGWGCLWRLRAFLLYHYIPCDRGTWAKLRDPVCGLLTLLCLLPVYGIRMVFQTVLLFCVAYGPLRPASAVYDATAAAAPTARSMVRELDEFQLVRYILAFKGTQFISGGILLAVKGGLQYFFLTTFVARRPQDDDDDADAAAAALSSTSSGGGGGDSMASVVSEQAPGAGGGEGLLLEALDFLSSVVLTWVAALLLPCSLKLGVKEKVAETKRDRDARLADEEAAGSGCCGQGGRGRGGRLLLLLKVDSCWFAFFVVLYAVAYSSFDHSGDDDDDDGEWRAASTLYWLRVLYSLTTFPFLLLTLPVFSKVLTHAERTGFNREGHCVPFQLRPPEPDKLNGGSPMSVVDDAELGGAVESAARDNL